MGFEWKDVMLTPPTSVTARDAVYELGCVLEAVALWKMARAAQLCADSRQGTPGEAVSQVSGKCVRECACKLQKESYRSLQTMCVWHLACHYLAHG